MSISNHAQYNANCKPQEVKRIMNLIDYDNYGELEDASNKKEFDFGSILNYKNNQLEERDFESFNTYESRMNKRG